MSFNPILNNNLNKSFTNPMVPFAPGRGYGFHQYINFGKKHKKKTYYDVATEGDFNYLRWCLSYDPHHTKNKKFASFYISEQCFPHIKAALQTEKSKHPWFPVYSPADQEGNLTMHYTSQDEQGQPINGPDIDMKFCLSCNKIKNYFLFELGNHDICRVCFIRRQTQAEQKRNNFNYKYNQSVEEPASYKPTHNVNYNKFHFPNKSVAPPVAAYSEAPPPGYNNNQGFDWTQNFESKKKSELIHRETKPKQQQPLEDITEHPEKENSDPK